MVSAQPGRLELSPNDEVHPTDVHVGAQIRAMRKARGLSQQCLAEKVQVSYQQIQKYETAGSRVSASVLHQIARVLEVPISAFFDGLDAPVGYEAPPTAAWEASKRLAVTAGGSELAQAYLALSNPVLRRQLVQFAKSLLAVEEAAPASAPARRRRRDAK